MPEPASFARLALVHVKAHANALAILKLPKPCAVPLAKEGWAVVCSYKAPPFFLSIAS